MTNLNQLDRESILLRNKGFKDDPWGEGWWTEGRPYGSQRNFSTESKTAKVIFKDLAQEVINQIQTHDAVVGCMAWLTEEKILSALAGIPSSIVVQKEDFLRPDGPLNKAHLRCAYDTIPALDRDRFGALLSIQGNGEEEKAVRCVGLRPSRQTTSAKMHHKFAVFGRLDCTCRAEAIHECYHEFIPQTVLTGSFNWTYNAGNSFENIVILSDPEIVRAYFNEFCQVLAFSEPLDWSDEYVAPEWRIGT